MLRTTPGRCRVPSPCPPCRRTRFYNPGVESVLKEYWELLTGCFKLYKAKDRSKFFWIEHWQAFLEANRWGPGYGRVRQGRLLNNLVGWLFVWVVVLVLNKIHLLFLP